VNPFEVKLQREIQTLTGGRLGDFAPSLQVAVYHKGRAKGFLRIGKPAEFFDLASLTKVIFTVSALMWFHDQGLISVEDPVAKHWPQFRHKRVRIRDLLTHTAGFPDWTAYFKRLRKLKGSELKRQALLELLLKESPKKRKKAVYSDLDFLILIPVLEAVSGQSIEALWVKFARRFGLSDLHFCAGPRPKFARQRYAPTEKCPWRKKHLRGEVHDDNTWSMGGVSTHAGLFGRLKDVGRFGLLLRQTYFRGSKLASRKTARLFLSRAIPRNRGDFALGYMMPSRDSSSGRYFSSSSVGHTGFTGTSIWFDAKRDLLVVVLSNRVSPTRTNIKFRQLRPLIHDAISKCLALT